GLLGSFPVRFLIDSWRITVKFIRRRPDAVHVLAFYKQALPREFFLAAACWLGKIPLIYDVKAGDFIDCYNRRGPFYRIMVRSILRQASVVLVEGGPYKPFLKQRFSIEAHYFPNFVPEAEVPTQVPRRLQDDELKILFVGYCHEEKGVRDLVEGCARLARANRSVALTLIGKEEVGFKAYADAFELPVRMRLQRLGRRPHPDVRAAMLENDIFCFPSRREGHSNAINEAMMSGMVITCTRRGFLERVVGAENGYFMDTGTADEVERSLIAIAEAPDEARARARRARAKLIAEFTSKVAVERLAVAYNQAFKENAEEFSRSARYHEPVANSPSSAD